MDYAIVKIKGHEYKLEAGQTVVVSRLAVKEKGPIKFEDVLLVVDGEKVTVGTPIIPGALVEGVVVEHLKGDKIRVSTYKSKSRYRRVKGHRDHLTRVKITRIVGREKKLQTKTESPSKKKNK